MKLLDGYRLEIFSIKWLLCLVSEHLQQVLQLYKIFFRKQNQLTSSKITSSISNLLSFLGSIWTDKRYLPLPFGITSIFCSALYLTSWQFDPCSQYRVEKTKRHERNSHETINKKATVTLTRNNKLPVNYVSNYISMHSIIAVSSLIFCYWKLSSHFTSQPDKTVVGIVAQSGVWCNNMDIIDNILWCIISERNNKYDLQTY